MSHRVGREGHPNPMQGSPRQRGAKAESALPFAATTEPAPDAVPHLQGGWGVNQTTDRPADRWRGDKHPRPGETNRP